MAAASELDQNIYQVCQEDCVTDYTTSKGHTRNCDDPKTANFIQSCYTPSVEESRLRQLIGANWNTYIPAILEGFPTRSYRGVIHTMQSIAYPSYQQAIHPLFLENTDKFKWCNDIICIYKAGNINLFHISVHSPKPKFYMGNHKKAHACGAYPRYGAVDQGMIHYKIERKYDIAFPDLGRPVKKYNAHANGTLSESEQKLSDHLYFSTSPSVEKNNIAIFHEFVYRQFIYHWNACIAYLLHHNDPTGDWVNMAVPPIMAQNIKPDLLAAATDGISPRPITALKWAALMREIPIISDTFERGQHNAPLFMEKPSATKPSASKPSATKPSASKPSATKSSATKSSPTKSTNVTPVKKGKLIMTKGIKIVKSSKAPASAPTLRRSHSTRSNRSASSTRSTSSKRSHRSHNHSHNHSLG